MMHAYESECIYPEMYIIFNREHFQQVSNALVSFCQKLVRLLNRIL